MYRKIGQVVETELGYFCQLPGDIIGVYVLAQHPESLVEEIKRATQCMPVGGRALVVGAHIGTIAVPLSRSCSELVAIEPNPRAFEVLRLNAAMNGRDNMMLANFAANDKEEMIEFVVEYNNSGGSKRMPVHKDKMFFQGKTETIQVPSARLDDALSGHEFDLVFMDCEGSEYFALQGMQRILARSRALIVEFIPTHITLAAGVTIEDFLRPIKEHFNDLFVPTTGRKAVREEFQSVLEDMVANNKTDSGIVFRKV